MKEKTLSNQDAPTTPREQVGSDALFSAVDMTTETNVEMLRELNRSLELICADAPIARKENVEHESAKLAIIRSIKMFCTPMVMINPSENDKIQQPKQ